MARFKKSKKNSELNVSEKANRILNVILVLLLLIGIRVWYLGVLQYDEKLEESKKPQRKVIVEKSDRATIRDRFNVPLAVNKIQYNASIVYGQLRQVPRFIWSKDENGKKIKVPYRKQYIKNLSELLAKELCLDPERIEDIIHSKAAIFHNIPFPIKENLSEAEYFRLKMLEKDWLGIHTEKIARRFYPLGPVGCDVIGYMGAISKNEYEAITSEMRSLRNFLNQWEEGKNADAQCRASVEEAEKKLIELEARAYTINDMVGKAGVEAFFDQKLRGFRGKKTYISDFQGNFLRELPQSMSPQPGQSFYLTISAELQEYAERLLAEYEEMEIARLGDFSKQGVIPPLQPWIKGGAIVVMDPNSGEILTLASYPRYDPNDFIKDPQDQEKKNWKVHRWLEDEIYIGGIWDRKIPLERERFSIEKGVFYEEKRELTWQTYLDLTFSVESVVRKKLLKLNTLSKVVDLQNKFYTLLHFFEEEGFWISPSKIIDFVYGEKAKKTSSIASIKEKKFLVHCFETKKELIQKALYEMEPYFNDIEHNNEKLLLVDLCRIIADSSRFSNEILDIIGDQTIEEYRNISGMLANVKEGIKKTAEVIFHENDFKAWRAQNFKAYLAEKRCEEESLKKPPKPYLDYLDNKEKELFSSFWQQYENELLSFLFTEKQHELHEDLNPFYMHLTALANEISQGAHAAASWSAHFLKLKEYFSCYAPNFILNYLPTFRSFKDLNRPLLGWYSGLRKEKNKQLEKHLASAFYPSCGYGYARSQAFRQSTIVGSVFKLVTSYEALIQRYQKLPSQSISAKNLNPLTMIDDKHKSFINPQSWNVGYTQEGKPIPMFYHGGRIPRSDHAGIGLIDIIRALETSSNPYFAVLAGEHMADPEDLGKTAKLLSYGEKTGIDLPGEIPGSIPKDIAYNRTGLYAMSIGQHSLVGTPLQTAVMLSAFANGGKVLKPQVVFKTTGNDKPYENNVLDSVRYFKKETVREIPLPYDIRQMLMQGMHKVVIGNKGTARNVKRFGSQFDDKNMESYFEICGQIVGKTSTAESLERLSLDATKGALMYKHVGFAVLSFDQKSLNENHFDKPELVVIVYLRFGDYGKQAAPLAVHMIKKWREIKAKQVLVDSK